MVKQFHNVFRLRHSIDATLRKTLSKHIGHVTVLNWLNLKKKGESSTPNAIRDVITNAD